MNVFVVCPEAGHTADNALSLSTDVIPVVGDYLVVEDHVALDVVNRSFAVEVGAGKKAKATALVLVCEKRIV